MGDKPELIVFSLNLMGGCANFHKNMLANRPDDFFDITCFYLNPLHWPGKRRDDVIVDPQNIIFEYHSEQPLEEVKRQLAALISNRAGLILTNLETELAALQNYKKSNKTICFICHDDAYLHLAKRYALIIDFFIAHNIAIYDELCRLLPGRKKEIHFIQHGVDVQYFERQYNTDAKLRLVFLARHIKEKGIYDLPKIDDELKKRKVDVDWV
ncbi:MAG: hypothetical protein RLY85_216, partial [Bacteroidota bacterium]